MAKKNLARTVIEGGRARFNQLERDHSHRVERARLREWLDVARADDELYECASPVPRPHVRKSFADKLAPCRRWLGARVGCPWDAVRGEIFRTFDTRTLAGRHIVFDHMLQEVADHFAEWRYRRFFVDDRGFLRRGERGPRYRRTYRPGMPEAELQAWSQGRRIGLSGELLYWFVPVRQRGPRTVPPRIHHRQDRPLDSAERAFHARLNETQRERLAFTKP
jgi:hypothetical protein